MHCMVLATPGAFFAAVDGGNVICCDAMKFITTLAGRAVSAISGTGRGAAMAAPVSDSFSNFHAYFG
jgi:hypothetical protein